MNCDWSSAEVMRLALEYGVWCNLGSMSVLYEPCISRYQVYYLNCTTTAKTKLSRRNGPDASLVVRHIARLPTTLSYFLAEQLNSWSKKRFVDGISPASSVSNIDLLTSSAELADICQVSSGPAKVAKATLCT